MEKLRHIFIEITNCCYQKCIHCSSCALAQSSDLIPLTIIKKMVREAKQLGLREMTLSGGEPFLYPDLSELLKFLYQENIGTSIYTCGVIKDVEGSLCPIPKQRFIELRKLNAKKVIFSLHGANASIQDTIAQTKGSFDYVMESLDRALDCGLNVELHVVPMKSNLECLEDILKIAKTKRIPRVSLLRFVPQGRGTIFLEPSKKDYLSLRKLYKKWKIQYQPIQLRMGTPYNCLTFDGKECTAGKDKLLINAKGEYFPCEAFKFLTGNRPTIYDVPVAEEWENDSLLNEMRNLRLGDVSVCSSCPMRNTCKGGCAGQRLHRNFSLKKGPDPCCLL